MKNDEAYKTAGTHFPETKENKRKENI